MRIDRETLALVLGCIACILAGLSPACEVPSAALSWIGGDDTLHIRSQECAPGIAARAMLLVFAVLSLVLLMVGRRQVTKFRYLAWFLLFSFMLVPALLTVVAPSIVKDSQIVYEQVDVVVGDMEYSFNHQQVAWRALQNFDRLIALVSASRQDPDPALLPVESLEWSSIHLIVDNILGYSNALLNLLGAGWYLAMAGLVCWIMGAYSGDPDAARRRAKDTVVVPLGAATLMLLALIPRIATQFHSDESRKNVANGHYLAATMHIERASASTPLREFSLYLMAEKARMVEQLYCQSCVEVRLRRANRALRTPGGFAIAVSELERVRRDHPDLPGLRYWLSISHILNGFTLLENGQYSAADHEFSKALSLVPIDALAWYGRAMVHTRLQNFDRAAKYLENAFAIQQTLGFKRLTLQGQLYLTQSWDSIRDGDVVSAHAHYARYLNPESW